MVFLKNNNKRGRNGGFGMKKRVLRGLPPKDIEVMLRMYLMQNWFNLSDEGVEDEIYDSYAMRSFIVIVWT